VPPVDVVEEALCFGWIDSLPRSLDDRRSMRLLSPRRAGSAWSRVNKEKIARLIERGAMHPSGLRVMTAAQADGSWTRLDVVETLEPPEDLRAALSADADAARYWAGFPPSTRRAIFEWIAAARTPETRARRIASTVTQAHDNIRANQYRQPKSGGKP
jgi:uncharacterized protein YdeI (YjbR/CyaY-like superfamily)